MSALLPLCPRVWLGTASSITDDGDSPPDRHGACTQRSQLKWVLPCLQHAFVLPLGKYTLQRKCNVLQSPSKSFYRKHLLYLSK